MNRPVQPLDDAQKLRKLKHATRTSGTGACKPAKTQPAPARPAPTPFRKRTPSVKPPTGGDQCQSTGCNHSPCRRRHEWSAIASARSLSERPTSTSKVRIVPVKSPLPDEEEKARGPHTRVRSHSSEAISCSPPHHFHDHMRKLGQETMPAPTLGTHGHGSSAPNSAREQADGSRGDTLCHVSSLLYPPEGSPVLPTLPPMATYTPEDAEQEQHRRVYESLYCSWAALPQHETQWVLCSLGMVRYKWTGDRYLECLPMHTDLFEAEIATHRAQRSVYKGEVIDVSPRSSLWSPRPLPGSRVSTRGVRTPPEGYITTREYLQRAKDALERVTLRLVGLQERRIPYTFLVMDQGDSLRRLQTLAERVNVSFPLPDVCDVPSYAQALLPNKARSQLLPPTVRYTEYGIALNRPRHLVDSPRAPASPRSITPPGLVEFKDPTVSHCHTILEAAREQGRLFCNLHAFSSYKLSALSSDSYPRPY